MASAKLTTLNDEIGGHLGATRRISKGLLSGLLGHREAGVYTLRKDSSDHASVAGL